jgi:O-antigen biosynthesis protein WbqP
MAEEFAKRLLDVSLALVMAGPALVVVLIASLAIKLESPGPALFWQVRVGRHRRPFKLLKLRTMFVGTESRGSHEVGTASVTKVGKVLRETKIDELPQILFVLRGDMSFVGPRPCLPMQTELIEERAQLGVYDVRPGITGKAQLAGIDMSTPKLLAETDAQYVQERSLRGDLRILAATLVGRGKGDAATRKIRQTSGDN